MSDTQHPWRDEDRLYELYVEEGLSSREVADRFGCNKSTILDWLDRHNIEKTPPKKEWPPSFYIDPGGRMTVKTQVDGVQYTCMLHRLLGVAEYGYDAVVDSIIHHKNGIPWDNRSENIQLMEDQKEHMIHHRQEYINRSKLNPKKVKEIREYHNKGLNSYQIAERYDVCPSTIRQVISRDIWSSVE